MIHITTVSSRRAVYCSIVVYYYIGYQRPRPQYTAKLNNNSVCSGCSTDSYSLSFSLFFSSVQFSCSVVSDSLRPHESQHARPPCPSPSPRVYSNSCSSSQWCYPAISSSVISLSSYPQSLPAAGSLPMSQLFAWGVLDFQLQHQSFQWTPRTDLL